MNMKTILRFPDVRAKVGLSRSTVYLRMSRNEFPQPVSLGDRAVGWLQSDIDQWLESRIALRSHDKQVA